MKPISEPMSLKQDDMDLLERKFAMYVLLAIDRHPGCTKTDIMRLENGNEKTKFQRINEMIQAGYVDLAQVEGYSTKRLVLTKEGDDLVKKLKKVRYALITKANKIIDDEDRDSE